MAKSGETYIYNYVRDSTLMEIEIVEQLKPESINTVVVILQRCEVITRTGWCR